MGDLLTPSINETNGRTPQFTEFVIFNEDFTSINSAGVNLSTETIMTGELDVVGIEGLDDLGDQREEFSHAFNLPCSRLKFHNCQITSSVVT